MNNFKRIVILITLNLRAEELSLYFYKNFLVRMMTIDELKFPIGQFICPEKITEALLVKYKNAIATFPERLKKEVLHLNDHQLNTPYRQDGWTIRQVVHHCADSHMNSLIRFKLALTEDNPTIRPYFEERWAELADSKTMPIESSLKMLEGIHERWTVLLNSLTQSDLARTFVHPQSGQQFQLAENIGIYAWHCDHHLAHVTTLKQRNGWDKN